MNEILKKNLLSLIDKNQIVFWYDANKEFTKDFEEFSFEGVRKIELTGDNDFEVKYEILKVDTVSKYLLYAQFREPDSIDNWLLDLQLANDQFRTDIYAIYRAELNLPASFFSVLKEHEAFFRKDKNKDELQKVSGYNTDTRNFELAMLAVCAKLNVYKLEDLVKELIKDEFCGDHKKMDDVKLYHLEAALWGELDLAYGYKGSDIKDFVVFLFEDSYNKAFNCDNLGTTNANLFLHCLKNALSLEEFELISEYCLDQLGMKDKLASVPYEKLLSFSDYSLVDQLILEDLTSRVENNDIYSKELQDVINERKNSKWYSDVYRHDYDGLKNALFMFERIRSFDYEMPSYQQGIQNYSSCWYVVDYYYRQFLTEVFESHNDYLKTIKKLVDDRYLNHYLRPLNENWMKYATAFLAQGWKNPNMCIAEKFWSHYAKPMLDDKRTAVVIISDALRYELGTQVVSKINGIDKYKASIDATIAALPTYTQVGMASLLPHKELKISSDGNEVQVDGVSSVGTSNRANILNSYLNGVNKACVMLADEAIQKTRDELRTIIRDNSIVFIYHNIIDNRGANGESDFVKACKDAADELAIIVMKLGSSNVTKMFITSDHGFLYQSQDLTPVDYVAGGNNQAGQTTKTNRRFLLGYDIEPLDGTIVTKLSNLGYSNTDELEVAFPNSILRYTLSGSDTHFVHGGLSLQEVVVPVITITKGTRNTVSYVELTMLSKPNSITTGTVSIKYYQADYITDRNKGFEAVFGIYAEDGTLLSNDIRRSISSDSLDVRDREFTINFSLKPASDDYRGKIVYIKAKQIVDNGRTKDIDVHPVMLKKNSVFELDF